ncbi:MAG: helix-turn-helix domain-containing protein [Verrucomicrobiia bacterium]
MLQETPRKPPAEQEYLTKQEIAERLRKTTRTIDFWMKKGLLPYIKLGHSILFHWPSVVNSLSARQVNA